MQLWIVLFGLNQWFILGRCWSIVCMLIGGFYTGLIALWVVRFFIKKRKNKVRKQMGDSYEKRIGYLFEQRGDLVIYNGLIRGYKDQGVDVIVLSKTDKTLHLIQCKNWHKKQMYLEDLRTIYAKLGRYRRDYLALDIEEISKALQKPLSHKKIATMLQTSQRYKRVQKQLYMASDRVITPQMQKALKSSKNGGFVYKDMSVKIESND